VQPSAQQLTDSRAVLDLARNRIGAVGVGALAQALRSAPAAHIRTLNLSGMESNAASSLL
jgi:hypothetical protein